MADDKYGPASYAATAIAESPLSGVAGVASGVAPVTDAHAERPDLVGRTVHGRYRIERLIGAGGMGGVYEAEHIEIGKHVALKLVHALHARDPQIAARIKQEARSIGSIESENIVQIFDAGEDPKLGIFLVMELLKGEDLGALLARKGTVSPMAAATIVSQAALGLSRAHAAGIVHRDLKPANVFLCSRDGGGTLVKLVDFGIAKLIRDANAASRQGGITRMGMVIGTPQYMSPEQAQGLLTVDHRTDVYSLGAVLFEAIAGQPPFRELPTYEQTILQIVTGTAPRLVKVAPHVPVELDELCADMLAHDPGARPPDVLAVRERLAAIFPELNGGRMPMRSLAGDAEPPRSWRDEPARVRRSAGASNPGTVLAGSEPLSGVGAAAPRPAPPLPPTPPPSARALLEETRDPGVFRRYGIHVAVTAAVAAAIGVALAGVLNVGTGGGTAGTGGPHAVGLAQASAGAATATPPTATTTPPSAPPPNANANANANLAHASAPQPIPLSAAPPKRGFHDRPRVPTPPPSATHATASAPAPSTAQSAQPAPPNEAPPERLVGGTSESKEF